MYVLQAIHKIFQTFSINTLATQIAEVMKGWSGLKNPLKWKGFKTLLLHNMVDDCL